MFITRVVLGFFEFILAVLMSGIIIFLTYRVFIRANPDFDMEQEIRNGNTAVGALVGAILFAASTILQRGMGSVVSMVRLHLAAPGEAGVSTLTLLAIALAHLTMSMLLALLTISVTLRLFGRLTRSRGWRPGQELQRNNLAVGLLLGSVVVIASMYVGDGVSALTKALVPQPALARVQIFR